MDSELVIGQEVWHFICFHDDNNQAVHLEDFYLCQSKIISIQTFVDSPPVYIVEDIEGADLKYGACAEQLYLSYEEAIEHLKERVTR